LESIDVESTVMMLFVAVSNLTAFTKPDVTGSLLSWNLTDPKLNGTGALPDVV
jgi:hypothetical protein